MRTDRLEHARAARERWGVAAILALTLAAYAQTLASSFHFDDYAILADPVLISPGGWWRVFRLGQTRPLTYFTFWLNYRLGGAAPGGFHALSLALHLAAVLVAWSVFRRLLKPWGAFAATAIFALHPLQSEAVAYIFARATLLATLFCLLAWRDWLDGREWRAVVWFVVGLLAKEECVAFPVFLLGVDWLRGRWRRPAWPPLLAMLAAAIAAGARLLYVAAHTSGAGIAHVQGVTRSSYLLTQPKVICEYLLLFVCPIGQNFDHNMRVFTGWNWPSLAALAALMALVAAAAWQRRTWGVWLLGALVLLAPSSSVIPLADLMFEHRLYLPLVSLSVAAAWLLEKLPRPALALLALALAATTGVRARVWSSEETLWADAVAKSPYKVRPKLQLARAVAQANPKRAVALLEEARRLDASNPETFTQMGTLLLDQHDPYGALREFDQALRRAPDSPDAHSNRGTALFLLGRLGEAEAEFLEALRLDPTHANARHNLSLLRRMRGENGTTDEHR
ncbi:MAG TPA: tetratricopeptide repeat protein [Bryobacterales bacterium]|nr:tetratricopeptide repeat protein [Bryobacterales bacterium]